MRRPSEHGVRGPMLSHVCSNREARIARIGQAIDEIAALGQDTELPELTRRLAVLWAVMAELDPGLATRLPGYCPDGR